MAPHADKPGQPDAPRADVAAAASGVADAATLLPRFVRRTLLAVVGVALAGAAYLSIMRGPAILLDLSGMAALFCG